MNEATRAALPLYPAWQELAEAAERWQRPGDEVPLVGLGCALLPSELPLSLGLRPWRVRPVAVAPTRASGLLQGFACSFLRQLLHRGLDGELAPLRGLTLVVSSCDSMRSLPALWRASGARPGRLFGLRLPTRLEGQAALELAEAELARWLAWLEELAGQRLEPGRLEEVARLENRRRAALRGLLVADGPLPCSLVELAARGAEALPLPRGVELLEAAREAVSLAPAPAPTGEPVRLALVGGLLEAAPLLAWLDAHDARLVLEDTCALGRSLDERCDLDPARPLADLAARLLRRPPCPIAAGSGARRWGELRRGLETSGAQGVLLVRQRGCEGHAFDGVLLGRGLDELGLAHLDLELEPGEAVSGQAATRLEAFLEMLSGLPVE